MLSLLGFLIILAPLVVVHELGHFFFARLFNVKAEAFSVGFGPVVWKRLIGETEWRLSAIPLGGYVKLLGEDREQPLPPELAHRSLQKADAWKRLLIFAGGPLFNFIFAVFVFMAILAIGEPQLANVIGRVVQNTSAAQAGFKSGDRVLSVNGKTLTKYEEFMNLVGEHPESPVAIQVLHQGETSPVVLTATPTPKSGFSIYGESKKVGEIDGLLPTARGMAIGVSDPQSIVGKAGLKTGDTLTEVNGVPLKNWEDLEAFFEGSKKGDTLRFKFKKASPADAQPIEISFTKDAKSSLRSWGVDSSELFIDKVIPESPAELSGVKPGDRLMAVAGKQVESFFELRDAVQKAGETHGKVALSWIREGKTMNADIVPTATGGRDPLLNKTTQYTVGVAPVLSFADPETVNERILNPAMLLIKSAERMVTFSYRNFVSIGKMFTGEVSVKTLGGPILIGKIAGESITRGVVAFLTTMAMLSIGLGVLNILPVPVLDGGHILLLGVEVIRRRPLTVRQMERIQLTGLALILMLMVVVMKNDLTRLPIFN
jgi:regulator of sigma E protease